MSGKLRPPSRMDQFNFPLFGMDWFAEVTPTGHVSSWVAYCGGGGSAKTGVKNNIILLHDDDLPLQISTGDEPGTGIKIYQHPQSKKLWLLVALPTKVRRYSLWPEVKPAGEVEIGTSCQVLAVSPMAEQFAVDTGLEGVFRIYSMTDDDAFVTQVMYTCEEHTKALTSMAFSPRGDRLISAGRDGSACIWKDGKLLTGLKCSLNEPNGPRGRPQQVLVRGCAFGDLDGRVAITVHSGRKSEAYLSRWQQTPDRKFVCLDRTVCFPSPVTAMSLSQDQQLLALGGTEGTAVAWSTEEWKPLKKFPSVHELPITCIAARPISQPFFGEEAKIHVRTGSMDNNTGVLSLERPPIKKRVPGSGGSSYCGWIMFLMHCALTGYLILAALSSMYPYAQDKCMQLQASRGRWAMVVCLFEEVIFVSPSKLGLSTAPY